MLRLDYLDGVYMGNIAHVPTLLNALVDDIWSDERLSPDNLSPHFPYFVTHFTNSMPICSVGGFLSGVLFNPKYAHHVYQITVALDNLGNATWTYDLMPGTSADVTILGSMWSCANAKTFL